MKMRKGKLLIEFSNKKNGLQFFFFQILATFSDIKPILILRQRTLKNNVNILNLVIKSKTSIFTIDKELPSKFIDLGNFLIKQLNKHFKQRNSF